MKVMIFLLLILCGSAVADVMNLNEFMPTRLEDATVIDETTWDVQWSTVYEEDHPDDLVINWPNLRYGAARQLQLDLQGTMYSGGEEKNSGDISLGAQYQFNESSTLTPMIAINPVFTFPTGKGSRGEDFEYKVIVTEDIIGTSENPIVQFHLNFRHSYNDRPDDNERTNRFMYTIGMSNKLYEQTALIIDIVLEEEIKNHKTSNKLEMGVHHDLGGKFQLGTALAAGFGQDSPSWAANVGIEKQF